MTTIMKTISNDWDIRYSVYVDDLIIFDHKIGTVDAKSRRIDADDKKTILFERNNTRPLLIKIPHAHLAIGDINNMSKVEVINKVKEYINE